MTRDEALSERLSELRPRSLDEVYSEALAVQSAIAAIYKRQGAADLSDGDYAMLDQAREAKERELEKLNAELHQRGEAGV